MKFWTWAEIKEKIEAECDLEDEDFVRPAELLGYANEAIDFAEAKIHDLCEDYFLKFVDIPITAGMEYIAIPTYMPDIYADKIRRAIFTSSGGGSVYTVKRLRDWKKFEEKALQDSTSSTDLYEYFLVNRTPGVPEMLMVPRTSEAGSMRVWFLRNANRMVQTTDICDIPECINFIFAYIKEKVYAKEGHPGYQEAKEKKDREERVMLDSLADRVPDADNEIEVDLSHYSDHN